MRHQLSRDHVPFVLLLCAFAVTGCAAGPRAKSATDAPAGAEPAPTTIEEAQAQLARAEQQLRAPSGHEPSSTQSSAGSMATRPTATPAAPTDAQASQPSQPSQAPQAGQASQPSQPSQAPQAGSAVAPSERASSSDARPVFPCESPCHAIASMRRAVSAICRIAGDADARCDVAKKTLADNEPRVKTCGC